jgi:hypothetical protein
MAKAVKSKKGTPVKSVATMKMESEIKSLKTVVESIKQDRERLLRLKVTKELNERMKRTFLILLPEE